MKFGKSLNNQVEETLPKWRNKFISYKKLKKNLKRLEPKDGHRSIKRPRFHDVATDDCWTAAMSEEEINFIQLLEDELVKFNNFFLKKEKVYIMRLRVLQNWFDKAKDSNENIIEIKKEIVDFHGEMILLENYSALNYIGLVKILKKFDKITGAYMRFPFIHKVLQQPFLATDMIYGLVKECDIMLDCLFPIISPHTCTEGAEEDSEYDCSPKTSSVTDSDGLLVAHEIINPHTCTDDTEEGNEWDPNITKSDGLRIHDDLAEIKDMQSIYMKSTITALNVLKEIRSKSSTINAFSLPPL